MDNASSLLSSSSAAATASLEAFSFLDVADTQLRSADRRKQLLELAYSKLTAVREHHRRISDAHLEARMRKERVQFDADRWNTLATRCQNATVVLERIGELNAVDVERYILVDHTEALAAASSVPSTTANQHGHEGKEHDSVDALTLHRREVEHSLQTVLQETEAARNQFVGTIEMQLAAAENERDFVAAEADELKSRWARLTQLKDATMANDAMILIAQSDTSAAAIGRRLAGDEAAKSAAELSQCHDMRVSLEDALAAAHASKMLVRVGKQHDELTTDVTPQQEDMTSFSKLLSLLEKIHNGDNDGTTQVINSLNDELLSLQQVVQATRSVEAQVADLREQFSSAAEVEVEQRRLRDVEATRDATRDAYDALTRRRAYLDAMLSASMTQSSIHSTDVNIESVKNASRGLPTLSEVSDSVIPSLERQVTSLTAELSTARDDLYLLEDELIVSRCVELRETLHMYQNTVLPERRQRVLSLRSQRLDGQRAVEAWYEEELPRHEAYLDQLRQDRFEWSQAVARAYGERDAVMTAIAALEHRSASNSERRTAMAAERRRWEEAGDDMAPTVTVSHQQRESSSGGAIDTQAEEEQWAEIVDARGMLCKRVRVPQAPWQPIVVGTNSHVPPHSLKSDMPSSSHSVVDNHHTSTTATDKKDNTGGRRFIGILKSFGLFQGLVDLVRGKPIVVPGGGAMLTLNV